MMEFRSFEDILDFAILQEKAAQQFYTDLSGKDAEGSGWEDAPKF